MADFLLKTLGISDSDDFKPFTFIQSQKKNPATGTVTERGQSLKQPLRRPVQCCLDFHIVQFALEVLNFSDNFSKIVEGHIIADYHQSIFVIMTRIIWLGNLIREVVVAMGDLESVDPDEKRFIFGDYSRRNILPPLLVLLFYR